MIEKKGERAKTWDDFTAELPDEDCRYAVIDVEFETDDGRPTSKIVFLSWCVSSALDCPSFFLFGPSSFPSSPGCHIPLTSISLTMQPPHQSHPRPTGRPTGLQGARHGQGAAKDGLRGLQGGHQARARRRRHPPQRNGQVGGWVGGCAQGKAGRAALSALSAIINHFPTQSSTTTILTPSPDHTPRPPQIGAGVRADPPLRQALHLTGRPTYLVGKQGGRQPA